MANKYRIENKHEIDGYIVFISNVLSPIRNKPNFQKRVLVVQFESQGYDQKVPFDFINERMRVAEGFALGDHVHVTFTLRGRERLKDGKKEWYPSVEGLNVSKI